MGAWVGCVRRNLARGSSPRAGLLWFAPPSRLRRMVYLLAVGLIVLALLAGLLVHRRWLRTGAASGAAGEDWLALNDLVVPVTTLAVVLLAFVMVEALASYGRARALVGEEAQIADQLAQEAPLLASRADALALRQELLCYVRA